MQNSNPYKLDNTEIRLIKTLQRGMKAGQASRLIATCECTGINFAVLKGLKKKGLIDYIKDVSYIDGYIVMLTPEGLGLEDLTESTFVSCGKC